MPRDGSGIYSTLAGTDGIPDRTIESARYNANVHDVEADLNAPRPIVAGGTGATNARDAMLALGGEFANQAVSNYDITQFLSGSFWSGVGATGAPNATDVFVGIAYASVPTVSDMYLEARSFATDIKYIRRRDSAGSWGPWSRENSDIIDLANTKVAIAGDTMTGPLQINNILGVTGSVTTAADFVANGNSIKFNPATVTLSYSVGTGQVVVAGAQFQVNSAIIATSSVVAGGDLLANGNVLKFNPGTVSLTYSSGTGNVTLAGAQFVVNSNFAATGTATAGVMQAQAGAGSNAFFNCLDDFAAIKGRFYWERASNTMRMLHADGSAVILDGVGMVDLGDGFRGRAGAGGATDFAKHNFFWNSSANQMWIDNVNLGNVAVTCDYRIKKDVAPLESTWNVVKALRPITYTQREYTPPGAEQPLFVNDDTWQWGFVAHELQDTLLPSAASGAKDSPTDIQSPNLLAVVAALTRALQEAQARIEALEARR